MQARITIQVGRSTSAPEKIHCHLMIGANLSTMVAVVEDVVMR
jgi:hypothetical protein